MQNVHQKLVTDLFLILKNIAYLILIRISCMQEISFKIKYFERGLSKHLKKSCLCFLFKTYSFFKHIQF